MAVNNHLRARRRKTPKTIYRLLKMHDRGIHEPSGSSGVPARMWRQILYDLGIEGSMYHALLTEYAQQLAIAAPIDRVKRSQIINNANRELGAPHMSWNKFMMGLQLLQMRNLQVVIRGTSPITGVQTEHTVPFDLTDLRTSLLTEEEHNAANTAESNMEDDAE